MKTCLNCKKRKEDSEFYKNNKSKDGLTSYCKICQIKASKKYYKENKKERIEYAKKWAKNNPEKRIINNTKYRKRNKEKIRKRENKRVKIKRKEDYQYRLNRNITCSMHAALKKNKSNYFWEDLVGYTIEELKEHLEEQFEEWMSWDNWGRIDEDYRTWQIDHIKPKNSFDFDSPEDKEFKECWALENLRPLDSYRNIREQ